RGTNRVTNFETTYDRRRRWQQPDDAGERNEPGIGASAGVAHLACGFPLVALAHVMHRTHLTRREPGAALFFIGNDRARLTAERERRRDDAGDLACEPEPDDPRETLPDGRHGPKQISTPFPL